MKIRISVPALVILFALLGLAAGCQPGDTAFRVTEGDAPPSPPATLPPTEAPSLAASPPDDSLPPTEATTSCFTLVAPDDWAEFGTNGQIKFEWHSQDGAASYRIEITYPNGNMEPHDLDGLSYERYLESFPVGGDYTWGVSAIDADGVEICTAGPRTFYKEHFMNP